MSTYEAHQARLLDQAIDTYNERNTPLSQTAQNAFMVTPRHLFVHRFYDQEQKEWTDLTPDNLDSYLPQIYADNPLTLSLGSSGASMIPPSTISQPSFVLHMLDLLDIQPGHSVYEIGTGSGWNAALISRIVGEQGTVYSAEILPEIAEGAQRSIDNLEIKNIHILSTDGGFGYPEAAPFDRITYTAGAYFVPEQLIHQLKPSGKLLFILKIPGGGDMLHIFEKRDGRLVSQSRMACGFVPLTGSAGLPELEPIDLAAENEWQRIRNQIDMSRFWWGFGEERSFRGLFHTRSARFFLNITKPDFRLFYNPDLKDDQRLAQLDFGLWDRAGESLVIARKKRLIRYGSPAAKDRMLDTLRLWVDLGMPPPEMFECTIYPAEIYSADHKPQSWSIRRKNTIINFRLSP